ncbi:CheR family methyltransferase [uncultured Thiodictyon sp.]|uniref:CheR family methyltransferase n=1 Tax=uncultured Thiodictyon sp. TaxID=1846217 RepID=UPI0025F7BC0B|nr:CheR family methyltransferase [uncultured Thiodictyon sp.]
MNLVADPYPDALHGQDLIFYRNLSIYFDAATREAVLRRLRTLLRPGGYLIVGLAETLANGFGLFALCEREGVWYFVNAAAEAQPPRALPTAVSGTADRCQPPVAPPAPAMVPLNPGPARDTAPQAASAPSPILDEARREAHRADHDASYRQALALARAERFAAALEVLAPLCAAPRALPLHLRLLAHLLLEGGDHEGAAAAARRVLALDAWSVDALVLLGRIARARGDLGEAVAHLRRAIYARADHWPAHLELAQCRAADGHPEAARREYRIALRLLGEAGPAADQTGPLPAVLPVADLRHLCRARLARLGEPA